MPIPLISDIVPKNDGAFPTHSSQYGKGGWHEVEVVEDLQTIPVSRRVAGMAGRVTTENKTYVLQDDLTTWAVDTSQGIDEAPIDGAAYVRKDGQWYEGVDEGTYE